MITLYHQDADLKFTDITKTAALPVRVGAWASLSLISTMTAFPIFTSPASAAMSSTAIWELQV